MDFRKIILRLPTSALHCHINQIHIAKNRYFYHEEDIIVELQQCKKVRQFLLTLNPYQKVAAMVPSVLHYFFFSLLSIEQKHHCNFSNSVQLPFLLIFSQINCHYFFFLFIIRRNLRHPNHIYKDALFDICQVFGCTFPTRFVILSIQRM